MRNNPNRAFESMILALRQAGLGPSAIAARTGLSRAHIYRLQCGQSRRPSMDSYERLERLHSQVVTKAAGPKVGG
jgi:transcriptional regulator with XRE-family HTH domain